MYSVCPVFCRCISSTFVVNKQHIGSCGYATRKLGSFCVHLHRQHRMPPVTNSSDLDDTSDDISDFGSVPQTLNVNENMPDLQHFCASYTLALEAKHDLSQSAVDDVLTATGSLVQHHLHNYASKVKDKLAELGVDTSVVDNIPFDSFLDSLNSSSKLCDYYKRPFIQRACCSKTWHKQSSA